MEDLKGRLLKTRDNAKLNKSSILGGLMSYAQYGADNPFNYGLTNDEIKNMKSADLINMLNTLTSYKHTITYFGPKALPAFTADITKAHSLPTSFKPAAPIKEFTYTVTDANKVYFADYDMVQAEIRWVRNSGLYDPENSAKIGLFNNYFGGGMGSIVFQNIRESKALAYSTFAVYSSPDSKDKENTIVAYVGAQADKMNDAVAGMNELLTTLPESEKSFNLSKNNVLNGLAAARITKDAIISSYFSNKKLGFDHDSRIDEYKNLKPLTFADINSFHQSNLSGKPYNYCIVASEKKIDIADLAKFGPTTKLSLTQIFGY